MTFALTPLDSPLARSGSELRARYLLRRLVGTTISSLPDDQFTYVSGSVRGHYLPDSVATTTGTSLLEPARSILGHSVGNALTPFATIPTEDAGTAFTSNAAIRRAIQKALTSLCAISKDDYFEVGIDNNLSVGLRTLFSRYPHTVLEVMPEILRELPASAESILSETLKTLANIDHIVVGEPLAGGIPDVRR